MHITGETLYIATESLDGTYTLRTYDARGRSRSHAAKQAVALEPFAPASVRTARIWT